MDQSSYSQENEADPSSAIPAPDTTKFPHAPDQNMGHVRHGVVYYLEGIPVLLQVQLHARRVQDFIQTPGGTSDRLRYDGKLIATVLPRQQYRYILRNFKLTYN